MTGDLLIEKKGSTLVEVNSEPELIKNKNVLLASKIFHHPNKVLFNSQPFELEVFTDFLEDELESVSLFYKKFSITLVETYF